MTPTILTRSGHYFDLADPQPDMVRIEDIAHALAHLCRFTGHTRVLYTVAQHSTHVSGTCPKHLALQGLLHDATEAYVGDIASPLKAMLPDYQAIEARVWLAIAERFGLPAELDPAIKDADLAMLTAERIYLMPRTPEPWPCEITHPPRVKFVLPQPPKLAREMFLARFEALTQAEDMNP